MERILKRVVTFLFVCVVTSVSAFAGNKSAGAAEFDWNPVMEAIIEVESNGNPNAVSGKSCGAMQITPILVKECNIILKRNNINKRYTLADRFSVEKSKEMFLLMQKTFNPTNNVEKAIRAWNGGNHYSVRRTQKYYEKVMKVLKRK